MLATRLREVITTTYLDGDAASAPVIAELLGERGEGRVILGEYFWTEALYALRAVVACRAIESSGSSCR